MAASNTSSGSPRDRIVHEARHLFAAQGFSGVTMRQIGSCVGLHNSSLFHYFGGKGEIAREVFDGVLERLLPLVEPIAADDPPDLDRFVEHIGAVAEHFLDEPDDARFLVRVFLDPEIFLESYVVGIDPENPENPVVRLFTLVWGWLDRARAANVIRPVRVYQATRNLFGILLFEPVYGFGGSPPESSSNQLDERRRQRGPELVAFVRGALAPMEGDR